MKKRIFIPLGIVGLLLMGMWCYALLNSSLPAFLSADSANIAVTINNLKFPSMIFVLTALLFFAFFFTPKLLRWKGFPNMIILIIISVFMFDIFRFVGKYTVFASQEYLYPTTKSIDFLRRQSGKFRIMATDSRILPPNFSGIHRLESIDGYDPLYTLRYAEFAAAIGRNDANINPPFGFNRIITLQNFHSSVINILNVKYILSFGEIQHENYFKVFQEGEISIYENKKFIERVFFVRHTLGATDKHDAIGKIFENKLSLSETAVIEGEKYKNFNREWSVGDAYIDDYNENEVVIRTQNKDEGFLVLTDSFYPTWEASIDGEKADIILTDYNFRGLIVPSGNHEVKFSNSLL